MSQEEFSPDPFSVEHIIPRARRGKHSRDNLAFSCLGCNNFKYTFVQARDPSGGEIVRLFHPRKQRWTDHFAWDETFTQIVGLTPAATPGTLRPG